MDEGGSGTQSKFVVVLAGGVSGVPRWPRRAIVLEEANKVVSRRRVGGGVTERHWLSG